MRPQIEEVVRRVTGRPPTDVRRFAVMRKAIGFFSSVCREVRVEVFRTTQRLQAHSGCRRKSWTFTVKRWLLGRIAGIEEERLKKAAGDNNQVGSIINAVERMQ